MEYKPGYLAGDVQRCEEAIYRKSKTTKEIREKIVDHQKLC
jgi:hypothetical protein